MGSTLWSGSFFYSGFYLQMARKREPTSRLKNRLPLLIRVIIHALQWFALPCKSRISKRFLLLWLALCCTVLRSRWYHSGINITLVFA